MMNTAEAAIIDLMIARFYTCGADRWAIANHPRCRLSLTDAFAAIDSLTAVGALVPGNKPGTLRLPV
jgi:hypothetical protein